MSLSLTVELAEMVCRFEHFGCGTFCDSWQWKLDTYRSASSDEGRYDIIFRNQKKEEETTSVEYTNSIGYGPSSFDGEMGFDEAVALLKDGSSLDKTGMTYMGNWRITGYDPHCDHCCGKHNGITASGRQAEFGVTCGINNLPLGTKIYIEGYGVYRVDDRGGMSKNHVDIACPSHDVCYQMTGYADVYVISYPD